MEIIKEVENCWNCPFYGNSMDGMYCKHPYWKDKGAYDCHIITDGSETPEECPLKTHEVRTITRLKTN